MFFDRAGYMKLYECSPKSKKLKIYRHGPKMLGLPIMYCMFSNYYLLFTAGFKFWTLTKGLLWTSLFSILAPINKNIENNASNVADIMHLN